MGDWSGMTAHLESWRRMNRAVGRVPSRERPGMRRGSKPMDFTMWLIVSFGSGVALGAATKKIGLWDLIIRRWNEDVPERQQVEQRAAPIKFRRLPPPR